MATDLSIYVDGVPLSHLGYWGDAIVTHRFPYGSWELTWRADYPVGYSNPAIRQDATVVAKVGPVPLWRGALSKFSVATGEFVAEGSIRGAETALAFNLAGATTDLDEAIFFAAYRGALDVGTLTDFGPPLSDTGTTSQINYVTDLFEAWSSQHGTNLVVTPDGLLYSIGDPTTPIVKLDRGGRELGVADDTYWTHLTGLYSPKPGTYALASATDESQGAGRREGAVDLTRRGTLTATQAQQILAAMLAKGLARTGWTEPIEASTGQIVNMGGASVEPWQVALRMATTGLMARVANMRDPRGLSLHTDVVIEETVWDTSTDTITMKPRGLAARDLASVVESMGGELVA